MSQTAFEVVSKFGEIAPENFKSVAKKFGEDYRHASLKSCGGVAQSEWHASEGKGAKQICERRLLLIIGMNRNLIVA